jgi:SET domain-containing protein
MQHPKRLHLVVAPSPIQGQGVFATEAIDRGAVILGVDDSRVLDQAHPLRPRDGESSIHCDYLPDGTVTLMRSPECYINHCCEPNSYIYSAGRERFLLAMRAIAAGEEILMDYALNAVDGDEWSAAAASLTAADITSATSSLFRRNFSANVSPTSIRGLPGYTPPAFSGCSPSRRELLV